MSSSRQQQQPTDALKEKLDSSISLVQHHAKRLETDLVNPTIKRGQELGGAYPVSATFLTAFVFFSFVPILSFIVFISFVSITTFIITTFFLVSFILSSAFIASCFLIPTLMFTMTLAFFTTSTLILLYLTYRLYVSLRTQPTLPAALSHLQSESRSLFSPELSLLPSAFSLPSLPFLSRATEPEDVYDSQGYLVKPQLDASQVREGEFKGKLSDARKALDEEVERLREVVKMEIEVAGAESKGLSGNGNGNGEKVGEIKTE